MKMPQARCSNCCKITSTCYSKGCNPDPIFIAKFLKKKSVSNTTSTIKPSQVEVIDRQYEAAHGKAPRGYGSWAFGTEPNTDCMEAKFFSGTFAEARAAARKWAVSVGIDTLYTQS